MVLTTEEKIIGAYIFVVSRYANPYTNTKSKNNIMWLEQIMVHDNEQGKGYGTELMNNFLGLGAKECRLICSDNLLPFYEKFGFAVEELVNGKELRYIMRR